MMKTSQTLKILKAHQNFILLHLIFLLYLLISLGTAEMSSGNTVTHIGLSMAWNIFLALVAFDFSYLAVQLKKPAAQIVLGLLWLLFYPNTFYMLTDAKHFSDWFDAQAIWKLSDFVTIMNFNLLIVAIIFGILLGAISIKLMLDAFVKHWCVRGLLIFIISFLSSIGIYVGRAGHLRLNSWDLFSNPLRTLQLIFQSINLENLAFFLLFTLTQCALIALYYFSQFSRQKS